MDELKDILFEKFCTSISAYLAPEDIDVFKKCIDIACNSQMQACFRANKRRKPILSAKITEEDYIELLKEDVCL